MKAQRERGVAAAFSQGAENYRCNGAHLHYMYMHMHM